MHLFILPHENLTRVQKKQTIFTMMAYTSAIPSVIVLHYPPILFDLVKNSRFLDCIRQNLTLPLLDFNTIEMYDYDLL